MAAAACRCSLIGAVTDEALTTELERLERKWVTTLTTRFKGDLPWPPNASDEVQFFSANFPKGDPHRADSVAEESATNRSSYIVCVSVTYNAYSHEIAGKVVPYVQTRSKGESWVIDDARSRSTRRALHVALSAYTRNPDAWSANGYASAADLLTSSSASRSPRRLVLIKTSLSPFLSTKPWADFSGSARRATVEAWNPNQHICDLIATIGESIDLWVIQGAHAWQHFLTNSPHITKWLLTPILSFESQRNGSIERFWQTRRKPEPLVAPCFPSC